MTEKNDHDPLMVGNEGFEKCETCMEVVKIDQIYKATDDEDCITTCVNCNTGSVVHGEDCECAKCVDHPSCACASGAVCECGKGMDRSIIARLGIGREEIEAIILKAVGKYIGDHSTSPDSNAVITSERATDEILDLIVEADEREARQRL